MGYIEAIAAKFPDFVSLASIGKSLEQRNVELVKVIF